MDQKVVEIVKARAGDYCETCGTSAQVSMALHHRKLKSRGGQDSPANLIRIHHKCHNLDTKSIHMNPSMAEQKGWMVGSWQDPTEAPFTRPDGSVVLLLDDGSVVELGKGKVNE